MTLLPAALPAAAQSLPPGRPPASDRVLTQVATELARLHGDVKLQLPRGEHYRAAGAALRILAVLDLDGEVRDGLTRLLAAQGRAWVLTMPLNQADVLSRLATVGSTVSANELRIGLDPLPLREATLDAMLAPSYTFSDTLERLAETLDRAGESTDAVSVPALFRTRNFDSCGEYHQMLIYLQFGLVVLCASGNAAGCIATAASIALIQHLLFVAGC